MDCIFFNLNDRKVGGGGSLEVTFFLLVNSDLYLCYIPYVSH